MAAVTHLKNASSVALGLVVLLGMMAIGFALFYGVTAFSFWVLKWTFPAFTITLAASLIFVAPLSFIPSTRSQAAFGFMLASSAIGAILWIWGMTYTYSVWGFFGVLVGLVFLGVGVLPVAMFAALVHGDWGNLGLFVVATIVSFGFRWLASWLAEKADDRLARLNEKRIPVPASKITNITIE